MVKKLLLSFMLLLLLPAAARAADFTATVDSNQVTAGEPFSLQLTLSGADAKSAPDTAALEQSFSIVEQAQTSSYNIINGNMSSSVGWQLSLIPKQEGHLTIPPVSVVTANGTLSTQPIEVDVGKGSGAPSAANGGRQVSLTATADAKDVYQDQPVRYAVKVIAHSDVTDLSLDDLTVDNAIVDKPDQPKISDDVQNGVPVKVVEYDFVITPMKPGRLVIPAPAVHGSVIAPMQIPDAFKGDFGDIFKSFQNMGSLPGVAGTQPFSLSGNEVDLDVKPPAVAMNPWLPLYSLQIKDEWSDLQNAKVGEPITRKITLLAEGGSGNQLPNLEADQNHADFRVYADKASVGTNNGKPGEHVVGWRHENYTLIPQKSGQLALPAIRVPWWNIEKKDVEYAELPEKIIEVTAASPGTAPATAATVSPAQVESSVQPTEPQMIVGNSGRSARFLCIVIGILLVGLLLLILWAFTMRKKISGLQQVVQEKPAVENNSKPAAPIVGSEELRSVRTPDELRQYLQAYAAGHWGTSANAPLEKILSATPAAMKKELESVIRDLTAALYAGRAIDIESLKRQVEDIRAWKPQKTGERKNSDRLPDLNPG